ncbi:HAD-IB family phosphatase [Microcoleus vaginatus]|uniref:HAD-IB family phosphatase n=1 Tax=Microcoleus vaginatus TaxID=119532 RepID=UPI00403F39E8
MKIPWKMKILSKNLHKILREIANKQRVTISFGQSRSIARQCTMNCVNFSRSRKVRLTMTDDKQKSSIPNNQQRVVFCDFDGTITVEETFVAMLKHFAPELSSQLMPEIYARRLSLRSGVRQLLESIPSECYGEIVEFSRGRLMRPGLLELLDFLDEKKVDFAIVSGGLRIMVETVMGDLVNRASVIYAVDVDASGPRLQVNSELEGDEELVSKVRVMAQHPAEEQVAIGDSLTDFNMALHASSVFARDRLAEYLDEQQKPYTKWDNFFDILESLSQKWN